MSVDCYKLKSMNPVFLYFDTMDLMKYTLDFSKWHTSSATRLEHRCTWDVLHSDLLLVSRPSNEQSEQQRLQVTPELHPDKRVKDRVQAAVGESNEPAHKERVVQIDTCVTVMEWRYHFVSQNPQKDDHVVRHPAEEEHRHDAED